MKLHEMAKRIDMEDGTTKWDYYDELPVEHRLFKSDNSIRVANLGLKSLRGLPKYIKGNVAAQENEIADLDDISNVVVEGKVDLANNQLTNLRDIHRRFKFIGDHLDISANPITSHVLGLLLINNMDGVWWSAPDNSPMHKAMMIIRTYFRPVAYDFVARKEAVYDCQEKLIAADLEDFAHL